MKELERHERLEIEVLDYLKKEKFLDSLVFGGGTMLRLCHELPRYSVDLDFWFAKEKEHQKFFGSLDRALASRYWLTDKKNKHYTLLYELKSPQSERRLKIEIRKEILTRGLESKIAFSKYAAQQVLLTGLSLGESARRKVLTACDRGEIRDFFDLEFLLRKGISFESDEGQKRIMIKKIDAFTKDDYAVSLGMLLGKELREHHAKTGFSYLKQHLT